MDVQTNENRRSKQRFDIELEVIYKIIYRSRIIGQGSGTTCNVSSGGLLFQPIGSLGDGDEVEVTIRWPARLDHTSRLNLVLRGKVVRHDAVGCAVKLLYYEFRTRASRPWVNSMATTQAAAACVSTARLLHS